MSKEFDALLYQLLGKIQRYHRLRHALAILCVKSRLVINALLEQFRFFLLPFFQRLNGRKMVERTLRNLLVVSVHIALKRCLQLSR